MFKKNKFIKFYILLISVFTIYVLLDTFVITKVYKVIDNNQKIENENINSDEDNIYEEENNDTNIISTDSQYKDSNIEINIKEYRENDTDIYVAEIVLSKASLLKTAFANDSYGKNITQKTSSIAESNNAILAINGDYYGVQEKGYVLKNGHIYRSDATTNRCDLAIYKDGTFEIINERNITAEELLNKGVYNLLSFGPALLTNNEIVVDENDEVGKSMASNPRTAIGIIDKLHYVFVVSDGRTSKSEGLSLYELANFMKNLGIDTAYNLDGGGSSTMYFNGKVINNPTTNGKSIKERSVSDIVYVGY